MTIKGTRLKIIVKQDFKKEKIVMATDKTEDIDNQEEEAEEVEQSQAKFTQEDIDKAVKSRLTREAEKTRALETELEELKAKIEQPEPEVDEPEDDVEESEVDTVDEEKKALQTKVEELEAKYQQERIDNAVKLELTKANARNLKAVQALMDMDAIEEQEDGSFTGIKEAVEQLKESDAYLFDLGVGAQGKATVAGNPNRKSDEKPNAFKDVFGRYM